MPAELDRIEDQGGRYAFVSRKVDAWHGLGTITEGDIPVDDFLRLAGLDDWNVVKEPLRIAVPNLDVPPQITGEPYMKIIERPGRFVTIRTKDGTIIGDNIGSKYVPFQNERILELAEFLIGGEHRLQPETGGSLKGGRWVFLTFRIDGAWNLQADPHVPYLALLSSHDGTLSLTGLATATRVVCANTANLALAGFDHGRFRIPHRTTIADRQDAMRVTMAGAIDYLSDLQVEADTFMHTPISTREFDVLLDGIFPYTDQSSDRTITFAKKARASVRDIYENSIEVGDFAGTAWGALQAVNVHELWHSLIKPGDRAEDVVRRERQIEALVSGGNVLTDKARELLVVGGN